MTIGKLLIPNPIFMPAHPPNLRADSHYFSEGSLTLKHVYLQVCIRGTPPQELMSLSITQRASPLIRHLLASLLWGTLQLKFLFTQYLEDLLGI